MGEARTITMDMVRKSMKYHCKAGVSITNGELYRLLGLKREEEKNRLRTRLNDMVNQGEVLRIGPGKYEYNFNFRLRKNTTYPVIWRFIRMQKEAWSIADVCRITLISYTQVARYCLWCEDEGYIVRYGKDGTNVLYRCTEKADLTPVTPYPDKADSNPFERECVAAADIARFMLCHDPHKPTTRRKIVEACNVLLARFGKNVTQLENEEGESE